MKKIILFFVMSLATSIAFTQVIYDRNNYGLAINKVDEGGYVEVTLPDGTVQIIKALINPGPTTRGRIVADGFIMDVPIMPQTIEWDANLQQKVGFGTYYNEPAGFTTYRATAYYVEGYTGSDKKMHYKVLQAKGRWGSQPNEDSWKRWYMNQPQPIKSFVRGVTIEKTFPQENIQAYIITL